MHTANARQLIELLPGPQVCEYHVILKSGQTDESAGSSIYQNLLEELMRGLTPNHV